VKRILLALTVAAIGWWTVVANSLPAAEPPGADWSSPASIEAGGITVSYPRAWKASVQETTIVLESGATRIMLIDYGPMKDGFPARPEHFTLDEDERHFLSCNRFEGWNVVFTDRGQAVQAFVKLGPGRRKSDAAEVLDQLVITSPRVLLET